MTTLALFLHSDDALQLSSAAIGLLAVWSILCAWAGYAAGSCALKRRGSGAAARE